MIRYAIDTLLGRARHRHLRYRAHAGFHNTSLTICRARHFRHAAADTRAFARLRRHDDGHRRCRHGMIFILMICVQAIYFTRRRKLLYHFSGFSMSPRVEQVSMREIDDAN